MSHQDRKHWLWGADGLRHSLVAVVFLLATARLAADPGTSLGHLLGWVAFVAAFELLRWADRRLTARLDAATRRRLLDRLEQQHRLTLTLEEREGLS